MIIIEINNRISNDIFKMVKIMLHSKTKCGQDFHNSSIYDISVFFNDSINAI